MAISYDTEKAMKMLRDATNTVLYQIETDERIRRERYIETFKLLQEVENFMVTAGADDSETSLLEKIREWLYS